MGHRQSNDGKIADAIPREHRTVHKHNSTLETVLLWKKYFARGIGETAFFKYLLAIFGGFSGLAGINPQYFLWLGFAYLAGCFVVGYIWYTKGLVSIENEIDNKFNPFQVEMRKKLSIHKA